MAAGLFAQFTAAREHVIPNLHTFGFAQIKVSDCAEIPLQELAARRLIKSIERVHKQLEIGILNRQARGRRGAGAGHSRYSPYLCLPRGVWGKQVKIRLFRGSNQESIRTRPGMPPPEKNLLRRRYPITKAQLWVKTKDSADQPILWHFCPAITAHLGGVYSRGWRNSRPKRRESPTAF